MPSVSYGTEVSLYLWSFYKLNNYKKDISFHSCYLFHFKLSTDNFTAISTTWDVFGMRTSYKIKLQKTKNTYILAKG